MTYLQWLDQYWLYYDASLGCESKAQTSFVRAAPAEHVTIARDSKRVTFTERDICDELVLQRFNLIKLLRTAQVKAVPQIVPVVSSCKYLSWFGQQRFTTTELFHGNDMFTG